MESPVPATIFTTSTNESMEPNMTNATQVQCDHAIPNYIFIFAYSLLFLVSLVLNCITMHVYFCTKQRVQSSITVYMKNLVASDFFLCFSLILRIASYASDSDIMCNIYCSFGAVAFYINMYASIFFMDFIALNRYLKIIQPLETQGLQSDHAARYFSAGAWFCLLLVSSIYIVFFLQTSWGNKLDRFSCEYMQSSEFNVTSKSIHCVTVVFFIFAMVSLILLYWKTFQKLRELKFSTRNRFTVRTYRKSRHNMQVLMVIFCVCFVPYHLVKLPYIFIRPLLNDCTSVQSMYIVKEVTILLAALNASFDPLIYFVLSKSYRNHFNLRSFLH